MSTNPRWRTRTHARARRRGDPVGVLAHQAVRPQRWRCASCLLPAFFEGGSSPVCGALACLSF
eukprot:9141920-Alexandrium_andersonii.AAC.1